MKDELISYETAVLTKEKGFDLETWYFYTAEQELECITNYITDRGEDIFYYVKEYEGFLAPTQSLLQKWLREVHNINIHIEHKPFNQKFGLKLTGNYYESDHGVLLPYNFKTYDNYEEALEEGLIKALKLIK